MKLEESTLRVRERCSWSAVLKMTQTSLNCLMLLVSGGEVIAIETATSYQTVYNVESIAELACH